jgi:hypothetical protein
MRRLSSSPGADDPGRPTPETIAQLTALGYVGGARPPGLRGDGVQPDPKDHIDEYNALVRRQRDTNRRR